ncbi:hypothetical protein THF1A12_1370003 [Vibrio jasicida]|uniref:Uncharacterized protein n=1 Tax=Vibrio jasicida TaxID=766224 RepID=A0AAU9QIQ2_9VIBR|nr:hypothetical protein THF1A12_1370003 [Vibrio jasicida]
MIGYKNHYPLTLATYAYGDSQRTVLEEWISFSIAKAHERL